MGWPGVLTHAQAVNARLIRLEIETMNTTHSDVILTIRNPESAPRDAVILGQFTACEGFTPAVWDEYSEFWVIPIARQEFIHGKAVRYFKSGRYLEKNLTGWMPLNPWPNVRIEQERV